MVCKNLTRQLTHGRADELVNNLFCSSVLKTHDSLTTRLTSQLNIPNLGNDQSLLINIFFVQTIIQRLLLGMFSKRNFVNITILIMLLCYYVIMSSPTSFKRHYCDRRAPGSVKQQSTGRSGQVGVNENLISWVNRTLSKVIIL